MRHLLLNTEPQTRFPSAHYEELPDFTSPLANGLHSLWLPSALEPRMAINVLHLNGKRETTVGECTFVAPERQNELTRRIPVEAGEDLQGLVRLPSPKRGKGRSPGLGSGCYPITRRLWCLYCGPLIIGGGHRCVSRQVFWQCRLALYPCGSGSSPVIVGLPSSFFRSCSAGLGSRKWVPRKRGASGARGGTSHLAPALLDLEDHSRFRTWRS